MAGVVGEKAEASSGASAMDKTLVQMWVKEAVAEALASANLIDGPTHIRHHQMIQDYCDTFSKVKAAGIAATVVTFVGGVITIVVLGFKSWIASGKG